MLHNKTTKNVLFANCLKDIVRKKIKKIPTDLTVDIIIFKTQCRPKKTNQLYCWFLGTAAATQPEVIIFPGCFISGKIS